MSEALFRGSHVILRPIEPEDAAYLFQWYKSGNFSLYRPSFHQVAHSEAEIVKYITFQRSIDPPLQIEVVILHASSLTPIGLMALSNIDRLNKKAEFSIGFYRGRATRCLVEALFQGIELSFSALSLNKLIFYVEESNQPALNLMQRFKLNQEGFFQKEILNAEGVPVGLYRFALFQSEWLQHPLRARLSEMLL